MFVNYIVKMLETIAFRAWSLSSRTATTIATTAKSGNMRPSAFCRKALSRVGYQWRIKRFVIELREETLLTADFT